MAFRDARGFVDGAVIDTDTCIVGAGAAGITLARRLAAAGRRVCLLVGGGFSRDDRLQQLYRGDHVGLHYPPLERTRLRYFGGTTNHWAGWCRPPLASDFAHRPWIADSGWPITLAELTPWLEEAQRVCDLAATGFTADAYARDGDGPLPLDPAVFHTRVTRFSPPTRFAAKYREEIAASAAVDACLHAHAVRLGGPAGRRVDEVACRSTGGGHFVVRPRQVVLATGGIENARLLLASPGASRHGLGNERDLVGRYFMDHFKYRVGEFVAAPGVELGFYQRAERGGSSLKGVLGLAEPVLAAGRISPANFEFRRLDGAAPRYRVDLRIDPAPNRDSRIRLDRVADRFGMPRVVVELHYGGIEPRTFAAAVEHLRGAVAEDRLGSLRVDGGGLADAAVNATGFHHMGATRMADDPALGVVDRHGRVHGVENLYLAGCSVFPGYEGYPTLTLVALALRLGERLASLS